MRIQIDPRWAIDWDGQCATLIRFTVITGEGKGARMTKAENIGKLRETNAGYFGSNLHQIIQAYVGKAALEGEGTIDLTALIAKLDQIEKAIKTLPMRLAGGTCAEQDEPEPPKASKPVPEPVTAPAAPPTPALSIVDL